MAMQIIKPYTTIDNIYIIYDTTPSKGIPKIQTTVYSYTVVITDVH